MAAPDVNLCRSSTRLERRDIIAVKRALSRAGFMQWGGSAPMWGPHAVRACKAFQKATRSSRTATTVSGRMRRC